MPLGRVSAFRFPPLAGDGFPPVEVRVEYRLEVPVPGRRQAGQRMRACGLKPFLAVLLGKVEHGERRVVRLLLDLHAAEDAVDDGRAVRPDLLGPAPDARVVPFGLQERLGHVGGVGGVRVPDVGREQPVRGYALAGMVD